jgi:NDP-sugar pyrophosphorylase family protein
MHAVILAAQKNYNLGKNWPEAMDLVEGRPKLEHVLDNLPQETEKIFFILGYRGDIIRRHFGSCWQSREVLYLWQYHLTESHDNILHRARKMLRNDELFVVESETFELRNL